MNLTSTQVASFQAGLGAALTNLQNQLVSNVFAESLPIIGAGLSDLANAGSTTSGNIGAKKIAALKDALGAKLAALSSGGSDLVVLKAVNDSLKEQGFTPTAKLINGSNFSVDFSDVTGSGEIKADVAPDLAMPGLDLQLTAPATTKGTITYDLNFQAGLDSGDAFILQQNEGAELNVSVDVNSGAFSKVAAKMGNLPYLVSAADPNLLAANFAVNLDGSRNVADAKIQSGAATPKLQLFTNFGTGTAMPGVGSTLEVGWDLAGATLDSNSNNVSFGAVPVVSFNNVGLDPGSFVSGVAGQVFSNITTYLDPVIGIAEKLSTPIPGIGPILSKLGLGGTFIDIIAGPGSPTATAVKQIASLGNTVTAINALSKTGGTLVDFGSFSFTTDGGGADIRNPAFSLSTVSPQITTSGAGAASNAALAKLTTDLTAIAGSGLAFPILQTPGEIFKFVLGQNANLVTYNPGPIVAELPDFGQSIPVFPGVNVGISVGASVGFNLGFGFDTRGIVDFANSGFTEPSNLLNGLFLTDFAGTPEAFFQMRIGATASIGIPAIAEGGIEGGIRGTINADFKDNFNVPSHPELANDGKLSYQEIAHQFQSSLNPLNLFDISGRIEAYLAAYLEFLFYTKRFDLGAFTIFDFEAEKAAAANAPVPILAQNGNLGSIQVNIGPSASQRIAGADGDLPESIRIRPVYNEKGNVVPNQVVIASVATTAKDNSVLSSIGGDVTLNGTELVALGGGGADVFRVSDDVKLPLNLLGGAGEDFIQGGASGDNLFGGEDADWIFGGSGIDTLTGDGGDDEVYGGPGNDSIIGGSGNDQLFGDEGNDTIYAETLGNPTNGNNTLQGGSGNDTLIGSLGSDVLDGGEGKDRLDGGGGGADIFYVDTKSDVIVNAGSSARIYSTASIYTLPADVNELYLSFELSEDGTEAIHNPISGVGNANANRIEGNNGNNFINALAGADSVLAGLGDDYVNGGADNDTLEGGNGNDTLLGGDGDDSLVGGEGDDYLSGGPGADTLVGGNGSDAYTIEAGDTVNDSGGGNDLIASPDTVDLTLSGLGGIEGVFLTGSKNSNAIGNNSANRLVGNKGKNLLAGNAGQGTLEGGKGDTLIGGPDTDTYKINDKSAKITEVDEDATNDTILSTVGYKIPLHVETFILADTVGYQVVIGNDQPNFIIVANKGKVNVSGAGGNDNISANFLGLSTLSATIFGGSGSDIIQGSNSDDLIYGHSPFIPAGDTFADNDEINGGKGNDTIFAGKGRDTVSGGDGDDYIHTLAKEISTLGGGLGDDTYEVAPGGIFNVLLFDESTGSGIDTIISAVDVDLLATRPGGGNVVQGVIERIELFGAGRNISGDGNANRITGNGEDNNLVGRGGPDVIFGEGGNDSLDGRDGGTAARDELYGGKGDDFYFIDDALDVVIEKRKEGTDSIESTFNFTLAPNFENLILTGTAVIGNGNFAANTIRGNAIPNALSGFFGNDSIYGGDGGDTISGGAGKDSIRGQGGNDVIEGGEQDDFIEGNDGADTIRGGGGNDSIYAQSSSLTGNEDNTDDNANDALFGDDGNDKLFGNGGNDTLDGGDGFDTMSGGSGNDHYYVNFAKDKVIEGVGAGFDFVYSSVSYNVPANVETLVLTGVANLNSTGTKENERIVGNAGDNILTGLDGNDVLEGGNGRDLLLGGEGNDELYGDKPGFLGSGDDTLDGGAGDDLMMGGFGNDLYLVDSVNDNVSEQAGSGFDTVRTGLTNYKLPLNVEELIYTGTKPATLDGAGEPNRIFGGPANDTLNPSAASGGSGIDTLFGGKGDDTYFVDDFADVVSENPGEGKDRVFVMSGSYALGDNVEDLTLVAVSITGPTSGTGNSLANNITGSTGPNLLFGLDGNDTLTGGGGSDTLDGGNGDDTFNITDQNTTIIETVNGGYDKAIVKVNNYILNPGAFVEEIQIAAIASVTGATGNELANILIANNAGNGLNGGGGSDKLIGGSGEDYLTGTNLSGIGEIDVLTGGAGPDHFQLTTGVDLLYDDGDANSAGRGDYAWIKDFKPAEGDRITMAGSTSGRVLFGSTLIFAGDAVVNGTGLFFDNDNDSVLDLTAPGAQDELIAFFEGTKIVPTVADIDFIFI